MNCKPGDLALWVKRGVLVEVGNRMFHGDVFTSIDGHKFPFTDGGHVAFAVKVLGAPQPNLSGGPAHGFLFRELPVKDRGLRPIRDSDGEDETLTWAGKPEKVTA